MFVDEKELLVKAGKGGDGAVLFRREKYVPKGGPDGGDGGRGGSVLAEGKGNLHALTHLMHIDRVQATDGQIGGHRRSTGKSGEDQKIQLPLGTEIYFKQEGGEWQKVAEIIDENQEYRLAKGGNGGWGNWHFRSSVQQAPEHANPGQPGEVHAVKFVLKLIADIGLVGLPNAGKSTLLASVSAARPKIADYPFTTLEPQLGVAETGRGEGKRHIVIADLPGLIEGASQGKGLGSKFLRHLERTRMLIHCLDASLPLDEIIANYKTVRGEIEKWSVELAAKPEEVALTKIDLVPAEELPEKIQQVGKATGQQVYAISAATHRGVQELLTSCA